MDDPMVDPKKRDRQEQQSHTWPASEHLNPLGAVASDWSRELNQMEQNPGVPNPKRTRAQREAYARSGGQL